MTTTTLTEFFSATNPVRDPLWSDLADMIRTKANNNPRNLQRELGPSEVGHPCLRKMAFGLMQVPRSNPEWDCLPSAFGVAMHTWLEDAAQQANERLGWERWITERRVEVAPGLSGTADLYDRITHTVIDWKNLGYTSFDKHVKDPGLTYKNQVQLYGRGYLRLGLPVRRVAIAMLPRTGTLTNMNLHFDDYSDEKADTVLARRNAVIALIDDLDIENNPERYQWIPNTPSECIFCPWWRPEPTNSMQCNGKAAA